MLVIGRREGEEIILRDHNDNYLGRVVCRMSKGKDGGEPLIRVGLELPAAIKINRRELDEQAFPAATQHAGITPVTNAAPPRITRPRSRRQARRGAA